MENFAASTDIPVRVLASDHNIGLCDNLRRLIEGASGEVIFFCDQDDLWLPNKIATLLGYLDHPHTEAVCCDSRPFDSATGSSYERTVWEIALKGDHPHPSVDVLWNKNFMSGHNIAIRREAMLRYLWPAGAQVFYDYWIALVTSARGTMELCPEVLTLYRQHGDNVIGVFGRRGTSRNVRNWTMTADTLDGVLEHVDSEGIALAPSVVARVRERSKYMRARVTYREAPFRHLATPFRLVASENGYFAFGNGWNSFRGDLFVLGDRHGRLHSLVFGRRRRAPKERARPQLAGGRLRLGVYADLSYRRDEQGISTTTPFVSWLSQLAEHVDELVLFGRLDPTPGRSPFDLVASDRIRFVALPYYPNLNALGGLASAVLPACSRWRRESAACHAVLVFGPHPLSMLFELQARSRGTPVFVGVRENFDDYLSHRTKGWRRLLAKPAALLMRQAHLRLASGGAVVVGDEMADVYRAHGVPVLQSGISLLHKGDFVPFEEVRSRPWPGTSTILVVGRLDPEKNPRLLLDIAEALLPAGRFTLEVAGTGSMADDLRHDAAERSLTNLTFHGRLRWEKLAQLYRERASLFLHVSLTEGQPQTLYEAAAFGVPIIATAVGGVASALGHGERGLLVPPRDLGAVLAAIEVLDRDPARRQQLVEAAWRWSFGETIDVQTGTVVSFIRRQLGQRARTSRDDIRGTSRPVSQSGEGGI